ncbi:hypothetical protein HYQ46_005107 [Verticillium longisporum]|nr:hypothetical protein HYQ46_005107 [Verticillium longisporum]
MAGWRFCSRVYYSGQNDLGSQTRKPHRRLEPQGQKGLSMRVARVKTELGKRLSVRGSLVSRRAERLFTGAVHGKPPELFDEQHAAVSASFGRTPALMLDDSGVQDFGLHRSRFRGATRACEGQKSTAHNRQMTYPTP